MKIHTFKTVLLLTATMLGISCDDSNEQLFVNGADAIEFTSDAALLLQALTANNTGNIDIADSFGCFDISYPLKVKANGQEISLNSTADFSKVEAVFDEQLYDTDVLEYVYPFALTGSDYQIVQVQNEEQLKALVNGCAGNLQQWGCVQITYPLMVTLNNDGSREEILNNDKELYAFLSNRFSGGFIMQYPVNVVGSSGTAIVINSNAELLQVLQQQAGACMQNSCTVSTTQFQQAYDDLKAITTVRQVFTMDALTHEYSFAMAHSGAICSIGYKAESRPVPIQYLIEIVDDHDVVVYSGSHVFSPYYKQYISIPPVAIQQGRAYAIRRTVASYAVGSGVGNILWNTYQSNTVSMLPYTHGDITINYSRYFNGGGSLDPVDYSVPDIDFVFRAQQ